MELEILRNKIDALVQEYAQIAFQKTVFEGGKSPIPPSGKLLGSKELQLMVEASLDGWLTAGRFNQEFEKRLANFIGTKHLITTNSGSSANLIAFNALTSPKLGEKSIKKGDEVITVAAGFPTTVNPIVQFGAIPVFIDINEITLNIDADLIESAITTKTKAVMLAHTLGNPFEVSKVKDICNRHGLWLIEDCCDALGAKFDNKMVGTWGDIATLSFYPAHHITMGEGGAVFTNNKSLKLIAESFRDWGRDCYCDPGCDNTCGNRFGQQFGTLPFGYDHKYTYSHLGYNLKITDMQAACGLAQLDKLDFFIKKRQDNHNYLANLLDPLKDFLDISVATPNSAPSWFGLAVTLKDNGDFGRTDLLKYLDQHKIGTRLLFAGNLIRQPSFVETKYRVYGNLEKTERAMKQTFWLGVQPSLDNEHHDYIAEKLSEFFGLNF